MRPSYPARRDAGFTVVELVVVMAILALILGLVTVARPKASRLRLDSTAAMIATGLRSARSASIRQGIDTLYVVDIGARAFGPPDDLRIVPPDMSLDLILASSEARDEAGGFRFYPSGRSSGGALILRSAGNVARIDVDWLTGDPWRH